MKSLWFCSRKGQKAGSSHSWPRRETRGPGAPSGSVGCPGTQRGLWLRSLLRSRVSSSASVGDQASEPLHRAVFSVDSCALPAPPSPHGQAYMTNHSCLSDSDMIAWQCGRCHPPYGGSDGGLRQEKRARTAGSSGRMGHYRALDDDGSGTMPAAACQSRVPAIAGRLWFDKCRLQPHNVVADRGYPCTSQTVSSLCGVQDASPRSGKRSPAAEAANGGRVDGGSRLVHWLSSPVAPKGACLEKNGRSST
jgi:hypothetical protein